MNCRLIFIFAMSSILLSCNVVSKVEPLSEVLDVPKTNIQSADGLPATNPKLVNTPDLLSCGGSHQFEEFWLLVQSCHGMKKTYFSFLTNLVHLEQGCAFHSWVPNGRTYIVKRVTKDADLRDGLPVYRVKTRSGILRKGGFVSPSSRYAALRFNAPLPVDCPYPR